jgi:hypothetical protein
VANRREKILILDRGNVELSIPRDWIFKPHPAGHVILKDAGDNASLEISYLHLPALEPHELPPLDAVMRLVLRGIPELAGGTVSVTETDRIDLKLAWAAYPYEGDDTGRRERRAARSRILIATNGRFFVLWTYNYWVDDASWAVAAWERMVATMHLGDGTQMRSPAEHWSMRE